MIKLTFLGAAQNVTGSRYLLEVDGVKLLVDCGLYQERALRGRNWEPLPVPASEVRAVLLTHAHLDHSGLLPRLARYGFSGKVYCTAATADIAKIMLPDSGAIQEEDAEFKSRRHARERRRGLHPEEALYTRRDAEACLPLLTPVEYGRAFQPAEGVEATMLDAGHVLGSASVRISARTPAADRTIVFSGDLGRWGTPLLHDPAVYRQADYVLVESTYGDRVHEEGTDIDQKLAEVVSSIVKGGGNLLIPSFALERSQDILYRMKRLMAAGQVPHVLVFLDSPMAANITEVFRRYPELLDPDLAEQLERGESPFDFPTLKTTCTIDESKAINRSRGPAVIIAGSGMCVGGRIKHHLVNNISRPESAVLFVGYQAVDTLGRQIVDGAPEVRILGDYYKVRARIERITSFSAHADRNDLNRWLDAFETAPRAVFVTHGEPASALALAAMIAERKGWKTELPEYRQEFVLD